MFEADSAGLDREVLRVRPDLVIRGRVTPLVEERVPNWVELYPDCGPFSTIWLDGERSTTEQVELSDLLAVVDRAHSAAGAHRPAGLYGRPRRAGL